MDIQQSIAQLTAERDRINKALEALREIDGSTAQASPADASQVRTWPHEASERRWRDRRQAGAEGRGTGKPRTGTSDQLTRRGRA